MGITTKKKKIACYIIIILILVLAVNVYAQRVNTKISDKIIRLHVIANSNSDEDQELKLKVRDAVLEYMQKNVSHNKKEAETYILNNLDTFKSIAEKVVHDNGFTYAINASYEVSEFPTKTYGNVKLPAGYYDSLKIQIGTSKGKNWWCVMFPPLCFIDATHGEIPEEFNEQLMNILEEDEYKLVTLSEEDSSIKIKFKLVEFIQHSKIQLEGLLK